MRILVACDVSSLWSACKRVFGDKARMDYDVLARSLTALFSDSEVDLKAYVLTHPGRTHTINRNLENFGFTVSEEPLQLNKNGKVIPTTCHVALTVDFLEDMDNYDQFVVVSNEGNFTSLFNNLVEKGKTVCVVAFAESPINSCKSVDTFHVLTKDVVYYDKV